MSKILEALERAALLVLIAFILLTLFACASPTEVCSNYWVRQSVDKYECWIEKTCLVSADDYAQFQGTRRSYPQCFTKPEQQR